MINRLVGLLVGIVGGFIVSWARLSDPSVIRDMLLLRDAHVFLVMASAIAVAAVGVRLLRSVSMHALVNGDPIAWSVDQPAARHVGGGALFALGWSVTGTCPGPLAAMIGEGKLGGLPIVLGIIAGAQIQAAWARKRTATRIVAAPINDALRR
jgi:uncharacterized protein